MSTFKDFMSGDLVSRISNPNSPSKTSNVLPNSDISAVEQQLLNTDYADLIRSNPYKSYDYKESAWQTLLSHLGFRTSADAYRESMALQSQEYINQVAQKAYNENYETPAAEADRARSGGLNPDLTGVGDVSGASAMIDDGNPPVSPDSDEAALSGLANFVMSAVSTAFGLVSNVQHMKQAQLAISSGEIGVAKDLMELSRVASGVLTPPEFDPDDKRRSAYYDKASDWAVRNVLPKGVRSRDVKRFRTMVRQQFESLPYQREAYDQAYQRAQSRGSYLGVLGSKFYNTSDQGMLIVNKGLLDIADDVRSIRASNDWKEEVYRSDRLDAEDAEYNTRHDKAVKEGQYWNLVDPTSMAGAFNASNTASSYAGKVAASINKGMNSIVSSLYSAASQGDTFSQCLLFAFSLGSLVKQSKVF